MYILHCIKKNKHFPITNSYNVYIHLLGLLQRINPAEHPSGYFKTKYKVRRTPNFRTKFDRCVQGFWIAHLRNNSVLKMNCLLIRPRWMWEEKDVIGNVPLHSLMIPG